MAQKPKSLLNIMFGAFLQEERKRLVNFSLEEICEKGMLSMSVSLYKMTEAGLVSFNINRIPNLIEVFKDSDLRFERLTKYVACQNIVDYYITSQNKAPKEAFGELADIDTEFKHLFEKVRIYYSLEGKTKLQKDFIHKKAIPEIRHFLQLPQYPSDPQQSFESGLIQKVKQVPSLSIELLLDFIGSFTSIIPLHFDKIASEWESKHSYDKDFRQVDGYYTDPDLIVSETNLKTFNYDYLSQDNILIRYVFDTNENIDDLKAKFKRNLNKCRKDKKLPMFENEVFDKIKFFKLPNEKKSIAEQLLIDPLSTNKSLQAFWVFTTVRGNKIGFVGINENYVNIGYNLSYAETIERSGKFNTLIDNV